MCGIAGFTQFHNTQGTAENLVSMGAALFHRGPDAGGEYLTDKVGLCHRRLSIIDLSQAGNQPMHSVDQRYTIVFNGEIYNFLSLKQELIRTVISVFSLRNRQKVHCGGDGLLAVSFARHATFSVGLTEKLQSSRVIAIEI